MNEINMLAGLMVCATISSGKSDNKTLLNNCIETMDGLKKY